MLGLLWSERARNDLRQILRFISEDDAVAARRLSERLDEAIVPVLEYPHLYRQGRIPGTREIVAHPNYIIVYSVRTEYIEIVAVLHTRQQYP